MKAREFNSIMPRLNEYWVARSLNMKVNTSPGVDVEDSRKIIEVKFRLVGSQSGAKSYSKIWTVLDHQLDYEDSERQFYWGFGEYTLSLPVKKIKTKNLGKLEGLVLGMELWVVDPSWVEGYEPSRCCGRTEISEWDNTFRYAKKKDLPKTEYSFKVEGGIINLTEGVDKFFFL